VTSIYECDVDILKENLRAKNKVSRSRLSKAKALTDRNTDARDRKHYHAAFADSKKSIIVNRCRMNNPKQFGKYFLEKGGGTSSTPYAE